MATALPVLGDPARLIDELIDSLAESEGELPDVVRRVVEVVVRALSVNGERISALARQVGARASQAELREVAANALADARQGADAAHARHLDALEATQQLELRLGARLEAANAASADALMALEASVLQRANERAASRSALEAALGRIDELGARLARLEGAHATPSQVAALAARADDGAERLQRLEQGSARLEAALARCALADEHAALAAEVDAHGVAQRDLRTAIDARAGRAEAADALGRLRTLEERSAASDAQLGEYPSARELRGVLDDRERLRALELELRAAREDSASRVTRDELGRELALLAPAAEVNGALAALRQTRDDYRLLAAAVERKLEALRGEARDNADALDAASRDLGARIDEERRGAEVREDEHARAAEREAAAMAAESAEVRRLIEAASQQAALHSKAVTSELLAEIERRAVAADVRELWEESQAQLSALSAADAQLRQRADAAAAQRAGVSEAAEASLNEARKLLADGAALHDVLRRELAAKAGHAELHAEARKAAREAVEPLISLQRAEMDERGAEVRKALAERAAALRDSIADELAEIQRALRGKAAAADVLGAASELRATLGASQEARLAEIRAETHASTQEALGAFRKNVKRTLAHAADELKLEVRAAVGGQVSHELADADARLERRIGGKADADALDAALRELARVEMLANGGLWAGTGPAGETALQALRRVDEDVSRQRAVLEPIWAETQVARFGWSSHKLRSAGRPAVRLVPWDAERINTDPAGFAWERPQPVVTPAEPGPYAVTVAFFSKVSGAASARAQRAARPSRPVSPRGVESGGCEGPSPAVPRLRPAPGACPALTRAPRMRPSRGRLPAPTAPAAPLAPSAAAAAHGPPARQRHARARQELGRARQARRRVRPRRGRRAAERGDAAEGRERVRRICGRRARGDRAAQPAQALTAVGRRTPIAAKHI